MKQFDKITLYRNRKKENVAFRVEVGWLRKHLSKEYGMEIGEFLYTYSKNDSEEILKAAKSDDASLLDFKQSITREQWLQSKNIEAERV